MHCKLNAEVETARRGECRSQKLEAQFYIRINCGSGEQTDTIRSLTVEICVVDRQLVLRHAA